MHLRRIIFSFRIVACWMFVFAAVASAQPPSERDAVLARISDAIANGQYGLAEQHTLSFVVSNPKDAAALELFGKLRVKQQRFEEGRALFRRSLEIEPTRFGALIELALVSFRLGDRNTSTNILIELDSKPRRAAERMELAEAFGFIGEYERALQVIEKLPIAVRDRDALPLRAKYYLAAGKTSKLKSLVPIAHRSSLSKPEIAVRFAETLQSAPLWKESADMLRAVIASSPQLGDPYLLLAIAQIHLREPGEAKTSLAKAAARSAEPSRVSFVRGLIVREKGELKEAISFFHESLSKRPGSPDVLSELIVTAIRANDPATAYRHAVELLKIDPAEPGYLYLHGAAALQRGLLAEAERSLLTLMKARPKDSKGCIALGLTLAAQAEKIEAARQQFETCIANDPSNSEAHYQLGLYNKSQGNTEAAIRYLEETVKLAPAYGLAYRDLGAVYLQAGAEPKARTNLEKAVRLIPDDAETHFQLSRLYNLIGETALARSHFERFQTLQNPNAN